MLSPSSAWVGLEAGPGDLITWLPTGSDHARDEKKFSSAWAGNRTLFFWKDMSLMREDSARAEKQGMTSDSAPFELSFPFVLSGIRKCKSTGNLDEEEI